MNESPSAYDATDPSGTPNSTLGVDNRYAHIFEPAMVSATFVHTYNTPANGGVQLWASVAAAFIQAASTNTMPPSAPQSDLLSDSIGQFGGVVPVAIGSTRDRLVREYHRCHADH